MKIKLLSDAEEDLVRGFWFYELQKSGLGSYFRSSVTADIESLDIYAGIHEMQQGVHRKLCKTFPYSIYYVMNSKVSLTIVAILDQRQNPETIKNRIAEFGE